MTLPNPHAFAVLLLCVLALFLFSREDLPIETSSLLILVLLAVGFTVYPYEGREIEPAQFITGFGNEALIAISALMIASQGLVATGALAPVGRFIVRYWTKAPYLLFLLLLVSTAVMSAFMNNTPQVVLMIPILVSVALRSGMAASQTLMPMTFAAQIGGMGTPIGTSLNLLVITSAAALGVGQFHMFDFIVPAAIAGSVGIAYLWLVAPRILPERELPMPDTSPRLFSAQLKLVEGSSAIGKKLSDAIAMSGGAMKVTRIQREPGIFMAHLPDLELKEGDRLYLQATPARLKEIEQALKGALYAGNELVDEEHPLTADEDQQIAELVVTPHSHFQGRTLGWIDLESRYQVVPLAHHRAEARLDSAAELKNIRLMAGDVLLVQGHQERIVELKQNSDLLVLDATTAVPETAKAPLALAIMGGIVLLASFKILPVFLSALLGVLAMIVLGCLRWQDAMRALDSKMILLTASSIALSFAMVTTGGAQYLADRFSSATMGLPGEYIISALILFMALLANIVSNTAAAVLGTPIAVKLALAMGLAPEPFVLAVLFGVNMSYATPMADNCNMLVYSAGNYKFTDFMRAGIPLMLIMWISYSLLLPRFFPL